MARAVGPDEGTRSVYTIVGGTWRSAAGLTATVYTDEAATTLANILTYPGGSAISGSQITVDSTSRLPLIQYPDGVDVVYVSVAGGPVTRQPARGSTGNSGGTYVSVKSYGATGDGSTDDTAAIGAAVAAAVASGGGIVYYPPGTYIASVIELPSLVIHQGAGRGATTLKLKSGTNSSFIKTTNFDSLTTTDTTTTPWGFGLRDLTVDGNKSGQSSGTSHGVAIYGCGYVIDNVHIVNCRSKGLWTEWATTTPSAASQVGGSMESFVTNFVIRSCDAGAITHQGPHDTQFLNGILVRNCTATSGDIVVDMPVDGRANGSTFTGLHFWGGQHDYCFRVNSSGIAINDCQMEGFLVAGIRFGASLSQVFGGKLFPGGVTWQVAKAIVLDAGVNNIDIDTKVENLSGGVLDVSAGSIGNLRVRVLASYYGGVAVPTNALIGTVDNNSQIDISVITSAGVLDPTTSIWRRGVVQIKPTYMSIGPTANSAIQMFLKSQTDSQRGMLFAQCSATQTADLLTFQDSTFADLWRFDKWARSIAAGADVSVAAGAVAASASIGSRGGKDGAGHISVTAAASPAAGALATVTFAHTYSAAPKAVTLVANNAAAATLSLYVSTINTSGFTVSCATAPGASAVLDIGWRVTG